MVALIAPAAGEPAPAPAPAPRRLIVPDTLEDSAPITLEGDLTRERHYGPPNYGETPERDRIEEAVILILRHPLCARGAEGERCGAQTLYNSLHLVISRDRFESVPREGCVAATGPLFRAHTGHHRRNILMRVDVFEPCGQ